MNQQQAYDILGLSPDVSKDDLKKKYKELAKQYHPDKNKDNQEEATKKFIEIQAAYEYLQNPPTEQLFGSGGFDNINFSDVFSNFMKHSSGYTQRPRVKRSHPVADINLTFQEAVLGCDKNIVYDRYIKCDGCNGNGSILSTDICKNCNGTGGNRISKGYVHISASCGVCGGSGKNSTLCNKCSHSGTILSQFSVNVKLPPGLENNQIIRLSGAGNYAGVSFAGDYFSEAFIKVSVESDPDMILEGENVVSNIEISLLEALKGLTKKVRTIKKDMTLKIHSGVKNKDILSINGYGVGGNGAHNFIINVKYPENTENLVKYLENELCIPIT